MTPTSHVIRVKATLYENAFHYSRLKSRYAERLVAIPMLITRLAKIVMCLVLGGFCVLVAFNNVTDYATNYVFVQHVLSMDTTLPDSNLKYRAISSPVLWQMAYAAIIATEALTGVLFIAGAASLWRARLAPADTFNRAKGYAIAAATLAFLIWFFGFMVVGGEWFAMWESQAWNGQEAAFRFYMAALVVLIFLNQADPDLR
jgi:predicted small integral membrane protein